MLSRGIVAGTNSGIVHTDASYCSTKRWKNVPDRRVGVGEVDVATPDPLRARVRDALGCARIRASRRAAGRASPRSPTRLRAAARCRAPSRGRCAPSALVHSTSAPCSALCTVLVTLKNSSLPWITCHSASMPRSRSSATWVGEQLGDAAAVRGGVHVQARACPRSGAASSRIRSSVPGSTASS